MGNCLCVYIAMCDYFRFVFIDLINNYNGFYENCLYNGFSYELLVCDGFLCILLLFLVLKRVMCMFEISVIFAGMLFNMIVNAIIF